MSTRTLEPEPMAKPKRNDAPVKIDAEVVRKGRIVAAFRGITLAEYFSERLDPLVSADLKEHLRDEPDPEAAPAPTGKRRKPGSSPS
jgi:hypothetical protein